MTAKWTDFGIFMNFCCKMRLFCVFKHRAWLHFWDGNPLKSFRENCTWRFFNFYFTLCRTVHQWLITRIPMGRWVRIPFQLCHKENHVGNFVYNSRHAMRQARGYLQQTISWFNFLKFTTNFAQCGIYQRIVEIRNFFGIIQSMFFFKYLNRQNFHIFE